MIDPNDVHSAALEIFDAALDDLRNAREKVAMLRAHQYTRDYDRMRKQAIAAARKPTQMHAQERPQAGTRERLVG